MTARGFYTIVLFAAIIILLGCTIWIITGSRLDATVVMAAVGATVAYMLWFYLDEK